MIKKIAISVKLLSKIRPIRVKKTILPKNTISSGTIGATTLLQTAKKAVPSQVFVGRKIYEIARSSGASPQFVGKLVRTHEAAEALSIRRLQRLFGIRSAAGTLAATSKYQQFIRQKLPEHLRTSFTHAGFLPSLVEASTIATAKLPREVRDKLLNISLPHILAAAKGANINKRTLAEIIRSGDLRRLRTLARQLEEGLLGWSIWT